MIFNVVFKDFDRTVEFKCGRSSLWKAQDAAMEWPDNPAKGGRLTYAWGYFAAKAAGKLEEIGIQDPAMTLDEIVDYLGDRWDLDIVNLMEKDPLADGQSK